MQTNLTVSQNFLTNGKLIANLLSQTDITHNDTVLDIGAGTGSITDVLAKNCREVVAYELDPTLYTNLLHKFSVYPNVKLLNVNFLQAVLPTEPYKVFSNIPFNHTAHIVNKLLFANRTPESCYIIMQKEAAERYLGNSEGYLIHTLLEPYFDMKITRTFNKSDFAPSPRVDVVMLEIKAKHVVPEILLDKTAFYDFVAYVLGQQRPTLKLRLTKIITNQQFYKLAQSLGFTTTIYAAALTPKQWLQLYKYITSHVIPEKRYLINGSFEKYSLTKNNQPKKHRTKTKYK